MQRQLYSKLEYKKNSELKIPKYHRKLDCQAQTLKSVYYLAIYRIYFGSLVKLIFRLKCKKGQWARVGQFQMPWENNSST